MRRLVGGGGVGLLYRQVPVIPRPIQPLGVGATACEVFLQNNMEMNVNGRKRSRAKGLLCLLSLTLLTQFLRVSGILPTMARLTSLAAISRSSIAAASL